MGVKKMGKKYKSLFRYIILSMIFILIIATMGNVYSSYNPTREEFRNAKASDLLRKKVRV